MHLKIGIIAPHGASIEQLKYLLSKINKKTIVNIQTSSSMMTIETILKNKHPSLRINKFIDNDYSSIYNPNNFKEINSVDKNHVKIILESDIILLLINSSRINKSLQCYTTYDLVSKIANNYEIVSSSGKVLENVEYKQNNTGRV